MTREADRPMARGELRIYLGAAPGVGKTFAMLNEGRRRQRPRHRRRRRLRRDPRPAGHRRADRRPRGRAPAHASSTAARRSRRWTSTRSWPGSPSVALVDELAHTNVPGSRNEKRWQDVEELLDAGIDVISTVNIQHLESLNDVVERDHRHHAAGDDPRRGRPRRRPGRARRHDARGAAAAHGPRQHLRPREGRRRARQLLPASATSARCASSPCCGWPTGSTRRSRTTGSGTASPDRGRHASGSSSRSPARPAATRSIRRAARMAARADGDLLGVHVRSGRRARRTPTRSARRHRALLDQLGGEYHEVVGRPTSPSRWSRSPRRERDPARPRREPASRWAELMQGSVDQPRASSQAGPIDVHVISPTRSRRSRRADGHCAPAPPTCSSRRRRGRWRAWVVALVGMPLCRARCYVASRTPSARPTVLLLFLLLVVVVAARRRAAARRSSPRSSRSCSPNWFFIAARSTAFTIARAGDLLALVVFLVVAARRQQAGRPRRRGARREARRGRRRPRRSPRSARHAVARRPMPLPRLVTELRSTLRPRRGRRLRAARRTGGWSRPWPATRCRDARRRRVTRADSAAGTMLVVAGPRSPAEDRTAQRLRGAARPRPTTLGCRPRRPPAAGLAEANDAPHRPPPRGVARPARRRSPRSRRPSPACSSTDIDWTPERRREFARDDRRGDRPADRAHRQPARHEPAPGRGARRACIAPVGVDEVVPRRAREPRPTARPASTSTSPRRCRSSRADAALLERAVANLVANAARLGADGQRVRVEAGDRRRPGRPPRRRPWAGHPGADQRTRVFQPFQRLGDRRRHDGVGLGLAVAGVRRRDGRRRSTIDDTPAAGPTVISSLPASATP